MQVRFLPRAQTKQSPFMGVLFCLPRSEKPNCFGFVRNRKAQPCLTDRSTKSVKRASHEGESLMSASEFTNSPTIPAESTKTKDLRVFLFWCSRATGLLQSWAGIELTTLYEFSTILHKWYTVVMSKKGAKKETRSAEVPYSRPVVVTVLAFVFASGGYGGYYVSKTAPSASVLSHEYETVLHEVIKIIDGDTFAVAGGARVRMLGINAPETDSCYAEEATYALSEMLLGRDVILQKDSTATDSRGRLLRYVFLHNSDVEKDNIFVNEHMVREGYAISSHIGPDRRYMRLLNNSMGLAENEQLGWHKECVEESDYMEIEDEVCVIKGNNNQGTTSDVYYTPDCYLYSRVKLRWSDGDRFYCTVEDAVTDGFREADHCVGEE